MRSFQLPSYRYAIVTIAALTAFLPPSLVEATTTHHQPSEETLQQLQLIEESMNRSVDPCDDFYAYACGSWPAHHQYMTTTTMYTVLHHKYLNSIAKMMHEHYPNLQGVKKENQTFVDKLHILYSESLTSKTSYFEEVQPDKDLQWPLVNRLQGGKQLQSFEKFDVFAFLGRMFSYGFNNVLITQSMLRHSNGTLKITVGKPKTTAFEQISVQDVLLKVGYRYDSTLFDKILQEVQTTHDVWQSLYSNFSRKSKDSMTYDQMTALYPKLAIFLDNMIPEQIKSDDLVEIANVNYIEFLLAKQWHQEELQQLCNYVMVRFGSYMRPLVIGEDSYDFLRNEMHLAVNFLYYQHYILPQQQQYNEAFDELQHNIYKHLLAIIDENNLRFTDNLIAAIKEKLSLLHITRGNLPDNVDFAKVDEFYSQLPDLEIDHHDVNVLKLLKFRLIEKITCPKHMECIADVGPTTGNIPQDDLLIVPFASFTPPMYHWHFDPLFSVSLMGTLLAHEYTHSMDTTTLSSEDVYETLHEDFLNHPEVSEAQQCMEDQQHSKHIRERVADFAGVRTAYRTYSKEYNVQPQFTTTSWQQLFFLNMAQYFCQVPHVKALLDDANDVRLRQIAMNMEEFSEAFKCPVGSKMNPEKKCRFY